MDEHSARRHADNYRSRWRALLARCGARDGAGIDTTLAAVQARYAEPHRAYHSWPHIAHVLNLADTHAADIADRDAVELAIVYHDAVYVPGRGDNESLSAELAEGDLGGLGISAKMIALVSALVRATAHGMAASSATDAPLDRDILLDLDLASLASDPAAYDEFGHKVRREFAAFSDEQWARGRSQFWTMMLAQPSIYRTAKLKAAWEARARANLERDLAQFAVQLASGRFS